MVPGSQTYPSGGSAYPAMQPSKLQPSGPPLDYQAAQLETNRSNSIPSSSSQSRKRKVVDSTPYEEEDGSGEWAAQLASLEDSKLRKARKKGEEKRLKRFRQRPPKSYLERLDRVRTQRMFLIERQKKSSEDGTHEEEVLDIAGSTGNIYQVTVGKVPRCTCPDNGKGNQCKHIVYVLVNVLKTREDLAYQLAFLTMELTKIFANAPLPQSSATSTQTTDTSGSRKLIEGNCAICYNEFEDSDKPEDVVWCKAACGQNLHRACFEQWLSATPGSQVKCVYCCTLWKGDEDKIKNINKSGKVSGDGYVNVASQLGINGVRDTSSYHQPWVRREFRGGRYGRGYGGYY